MITIKKTPEKSATELNYTMGSVQQDGGVKKALKNILSAPIKGAKYMKKIVDTANAVKNGTINKTSENAYAETDTEGQSAQATRTSNGWMTSWDAKKAAEWDHDFLYADEKTKKKIIDNHFPKKIKSSSIRLKTALEKKQRPFSSELYKSLIRYTEKAGGSGDISEANAKILISAESIIGPIFTKFGTSKLKLEDQSDFQLKAIAFFQSKGLDLNLLRQSGHWKSEGQMKTAIQNNEFSEEEMKKIKSKGASSKGGDREDALRKKILEIVKNQPELEETLKDLNYDELKDMLAYFTTSGGN